MRTRAARLTETRTETPTRRPPTTEVRPPAPVGLAELQRSAGNEAVLALLAAGQPKLTVGAAGDRYEREAEVVASAVMSRLAAGGATSGDAGRLAPEEDLEPVARSVSRLQRSRDGVIGPAGGELDEATEATIDAARGGGRPLPGGVRSSMESAFGADFAGVRVHEGSGAEALNHDVGALAFTVGSNIFLGRSAPAMTGPAGQNLLAHELTHTIQQGASPRLSRQVDDKRELSSDVYEPPSRGEKAETDEIQRFPATALSSPIKWTTPKPTVFRPGEGLSGGIYVLTATEENPEIKTVVVKPVFGDTQYEETGDTLQFGDRMVQMLGIHSPVSRVVKVGSKEFSELLSLVTPLQPVNPNPEEVNRDWWDLSQAQSFVVMSEVPKARSIKSLSEGAATDESKRNDLYSAIFSDSFLDDLGRLAVGDLLMGNQDRLTMGKLNLGNLMVSVQDGKTNLYGVDTSATLPKARAPKEIIRSGGYGGGFDMTKKDLDDPIVILDRFFRYVIGAVKNGSEPKVEGGPPAAWEMFQQEFDRRHDAIAEKFKTAWDNALFAVFTLLHTEEGRHEMKSMTKDYEGSGSENKLDYHQLKTNAMYLSGRSEGKGHEQSGAEAAAYLAYQQVLEFDPAQFEGLDTGNVKPWAAGRLRSTATSANLDALPGLPAWKSVGLVGNTRNPFSQQKFDQAIFMVEQARNSLADELGTKEKGGKEVARNRVVAGNYIADSYLEVIGARRALARYAELEKELEKIPAMLGGGLDKARLSKAAGNVDVMLRAKVALERAIADYTESVGELAKNVKKIRKYRDATTLTTNLKEMVDTLNQGSAAITQRLQALNLQALVGRLR